MPGSSRFSGSEAQEDKRGIQALRVVAQTAGQQGNLSENHWSIYMRPTDTSKKWEYQSDSSDSESTEKVEAVRVNMSGIGQPSGRGRLRWYDLKYWVSTSQLDYIEFLPSRPLRVKDVARAIFSRRREHYAMSPSGSGCRAWVYQVICDLVADQFLPQDAAYNAWNIMQWRYHKSSPRTTIEWDPGYFHDGDSDHDAD